jgi:hypothetical protein
LDFKEYFKQHQMLTEHLGPDDWRFCLLGAYSELGETLHELPWRPWRVADHRAPTKTETLEALREAADAIGALTRLFTHLGVTAEEFDSAMQDHISVKWARIGNGTDQVKGR